jgi:hypothetical protein
MILMEQVVKRLAPKRRVRRDNSLAMDWKVIYEFLKLEARSATISKKLMKPIFIST